MRSPREQSTHSCRISTPCARTALQKSEFVPYFQPIVTIRSGQLAGFEVLARWMRPGFGLVPPNDFIPLAEKNGWIDALTQQILHKAFAAASCIPDPLTLAINISPVQLHNAGLPVLIRETAAASGFPLHRLVIEITESAFIDNLGGAVRIVDELKSMGCDIALDDFGTGYSSLYHLQSFPLDKLKVDRSFVSSMTEKRESRKIVAAVVGLGQSLGLKTVAEGIETREQAEMMLWLGCDLGQGWFYGRPVPENELATVVAATQQKLPVDQTAAWKELSATYLNGSPSQRLAQIHAVYDGVPIGLCLIDANLRYVNINQQLADLNGVPVSAHIGHMFEERVSPEVFRLVKPYLLRALKGDAIPGLEITRPSAQSARGNLTDLSYFQPVRDEAGEVIGVSVAVVDVTQRKQAEEALRLIDDRYRHAIQLSPHILWILDANGMNLEVIPRSAAKRYQWTPSKTFVATPIPLQYMSPRLYAAAAAPFFDAS